MTKPNVKNIIFPIEFNHYNGGMIHSVMALASSLKNDFNIYILAHSNADVFTKNNDLLTLRMENKWVVSFKSPIKTLKCYLEIKNILKNFKNSETIVITNNVGSELILSGFGFIPIKLKRVFVSRGGDYLGKTGWFIKKSFKSVNKFIAISNRQKEVLNKVGVKDDLIAIIHNGIKVSKAKKIIVK